METNIEELIDELRRFADNRVHPIVSPDHWNVYSQLVDFIDELDESLKEQEPKTVLDGDYCPWCSTTATRTMGVQKLHLGTCYCPYCGQAVKWNERNNGNNTQAN